MMVLMMLIVENIKGFQSTWIQVMEVEWIQEAAPPEMRIWMFSGFWQKWEVWQIIILGSPTDGGLNSNLSLPSIFFCQFLLRPESAWFALAWWRGRQGGGTTVSALTAEQRVKMILWGEDCTEDCRRCGLVLTKRFTTILTSGWSICPAQPVHLNATLAAFMLTNNYREMLCLNSLATVRNFTTQVCVVKSAFLL